MTFQDAAPALEHGCINTIQKKKKNIQKQIYELKKSTSKKNVETWILDTEKAANQQQIEPGTGILDPISGPQDPWTTIQDTQVEADARVMAAEVKIRR